MKKIVLIAFALILGLNTYAQRRDRMGNPVVPRKTTEQEIEKRQKMIEERREEYINNFISTLEADDFQKVIVKQHLDSYYDAKIALFKVKYEHSLDREKAIKNLDDTHFTELEELISENDMVKIKDLIKGDFDDKEIKKEKKKKRRKKKRDKDNG